jgi:hypothetical protein
MGMVQCQKSNPILNPIVKINVPASEMMLRYIYCAYGVYYGLADGTKSAFAKQQLEETSYGHSPKSFGLCK